jgi:hypothetical protein
MSNNTPHTTSPLVHVWIVALEVALPDLSPSQMQQWKHRLLTATSIDQQRDRLQQFMHFGQSQLLNAYERELATAAHQLQRWLAVSRRSNAHHNSYSKSAKKAASNVTSQLNHLRVSPKSALEMSSNAFGRSNETINVLQTGQQQQPLPDDGKQINESNQKQQDRQHERETVKRWRTFTLFNMNFWASRNSASIMTLTIAGVCLLLLNMFILCFAYQKSTRKRRLLLSSSNATSNSSSDVRTSVEDDFESKARKSGKGLTLNESEKIALQCSVDLCDLQSSETSEKLTAKLLPVGFTSLTCSSSSGTEPSDELYHMCHATSVGPFAFGQSTFDSSDMSLTGDAKQQQTYLYAQIQLSDQQAHAAQPDLCKTSHKRSVQFADLPPINNNKSNDNGPSYGLYCDCGMVDVVPSQQTTASLLALLSQQSHNNDKGSSDSPVSLPLMHSPCLLSTCNSSAVVGSQAHSHRLHPHYFSEQVNAQPLTFSSGSAANLMLNGQQLYTSLPSTESSTLPVDVNSFPVTLQAESVPSNYSDSSLFVKLN